MALWIVLAVIGAGLVYTFYLYNRLVRGRNRVEQGESDITIQLRRRYNIIPNLIESVKGYMSHERETMEAVTEARTVAMKAQKGSDLGASRRAENMLEGALKTLFAVSESYPDLKANQNFLHLQEEVVDAEDKIQAARRLYNSSLREFTDLTQIFPSNVIAGMFKFDADEYEYFEVDDPTTVADAPKVKF